jgi:phosphatidylinositol alpha-mannosyltransferase
LARALCELIADPARRGELSARGGQVARQYDWSVIARRILAVYETVVPAGGGEVTAGEEEPPELPAPGPVRRLARSRGGGR